MQAEDVYSQWIYMQLKASLASAKGYWLEAGLGEESWESYQRNIMCCPHNKANDNTTEVSLSCYARNFRDP